ncbi:unnamed protein product [Thelazia callipaeda]|uniref:BHLH domain-containing protein n=1 Tax=Thelazia callipaeda TaxID=103827 RepID=A0A0N5CW18_THECL|nr:unnamed protein product [Thelazia callipaeda]
MQHGQKLSPSKSGEANNEFHESSRRGLHHSNSYPLTQPRSLRKRDFEVQGSDALARSRSLNWTSPSTSVLRNIKALITPVLLSPVLEKLRAAVSKKPKKDSETSGSENFHTLLPGVATSPSMAEQERSNIPISQTTVRLAKTSIEGDANSQGLNLSGEMQPTKDLELCESSQDAGLGNERSRQQRLLHFLCTPSPQRRSSPPDLSLNFSLSDQDSPNLEREASPQRMQPQNSSNSPRQRAESADVRLQISPQRGHRLDLEMWSQQHAVSLNRRLGVPPRYRQIRPRRRHAESPDLGLEISPQRREPNIRLSAQRNRSPDVVLNLVRRDTESTDLGLDLSNSSNSNSAEELSLNLDMMFSSPSSVVDAEIRDLKTEKQLQHGESSCVQPSHGSSSEVPQNRGETSELQHQQRLSALCNDMTSPQLGMPSVVRFTVSPDSGTPSPTQRASAANSKTPSPEQCSTSQRLRMLQKRRNTMPRFLRDVLSILNPSNAGLSRSVDVFVMTKSGVKVQTITASSGHIFVSNSRSATDEECLMIAIQRDSSNNTRECDKSSPRTPQNRREHLRQLHKKLQLAPRQRHPYERSRQLARQERLQQAPERSHGRLQQTPEPSHERLQQTPEPSHGRLQQALHDERPQRAPRTHTSRRDSDSMQDSFCSCNHCFDIIVDLLQHDYILYINPDDGQYCIQY